MSVRGARPMTGVESCVFVNPFEEFFAVLKLELEGTMVSCHICVTWQMTDK